MFLKEINKWQGMAKAEKIAGNYTKEQFALGVLYGLRAAQAMIEHASQPSNAADPLQPCDHPGCENHVSHPCEGCGRQWGR